MEGEMNLPAVMSQIVSCSNKAGCALGDFVRQLSKSPERCFDWREIQGDFVGEPRLEQPQS